MENCVRSECYDEALRMYCHVRRSLDRHPGIGLLRSLADETQRIKQLMSQQLLRDLKGNSQLPNCLRIVSLLRKLDLFSESEIRIKFLTVSQSQARVMQGGRQGREGKGMQDEREAGGHGRQAQGQSSRGAGES